MKVGRIGLPALLGIVWWLYEPLLVKLKAALSQAWRMADVCLEPWWPLGDVCAKCQQDGGGYVPCV